MWLKSEKNLEKGYDEILGSMTESCYSLITDLYCNDLRCKMFACMQTTAEVLYLHNYLSPHLAI